MICRAAPLVLLAPVLLLAACHGAGPHAATRPAGAAAMINQGYALLYSTVSQVSQLGKVLILRNPNPQLTALIEAIAQFSGEAESRLQTFAQEDPTLGLNDDGLPEIETRTRDSINSAVAKQVLFSGGKEFEFEVLLTQHEALQYITHLAQTLSEHDAHETRSRSLAQLAEESQLLHEQVVAQLKAPYVGQPE